MLIHGLQEFLTSLFFHAKMHPRIFYDLRRNISQNYTEMSVGLPSAFKRLPSPRSTAQKNRSHRNF